MIPRARTALVLALIAGAAALEARVSKKSKPIQPLTSREYADFVQKFDYEAHTIRLADFLKRRNDPDAVVADLREKDAFDRGHMAGAVWLGPDITHERLAAVVPSKETALLIYCDNSLFPTRRISLTDVALPQIVFLGHEKVWMLAPIYTDRDHDPNAVPWEGTGGPHTR